MSNLREQERLETLNQVNDALSVLDEINKLCIYAANINEQLKAARIYVIQSSKMRTIKSNKPTEQSDKDIINDFIAKIVLFFACIFGYCAYVEGHLVQLIVCIVLILWAIYLIYTIKKRKAARQCVQRIVAEPLNKLSSEQESSYSDDMKEISNAINQTTAQNKSILAYIPGDYHNCDAVAYFKQMLENKRAYSLQEAVNLYEQHLYQLRMENKSSQMLEQAQKQTQLLRAIERDTSDTATYAALMYILG